MSHNTLKLNTNSFDVNSNRTESISALTYAYVETTQTPSTYPYTPSNGDPYLFYRGTVINQISGLNLIDHPTHTNWIQYFDFTSDGVYRIEAQAFLLHASINTGNQQRLYLRSTGSVLGSNIFRAYNSSSLPVTTTSESFLEVSGSTVRMYVEIAYMFNFSSSVTDSIGSSSIFIEKLE